MRDARCSPPLTNSKERRKQGRLRGRERVIIELICVQNGRANRYSAGRMGERAAEGAGGRRGRCRATRRVEKAAHLGLEEHYQEAERYAHL